MTPYRFHRRKLRLVLVATASLLITGVVQAQTAPMGPGFAAATDAYKAYANSI